MKKTYFNSYLEKEIYKEIKIEAVQLNITIKQHISNILKSYVNSKKKRKMNGLINDEKTFGSYQTGEEFLFPANHK